RATVPDDPRTVPDREGRDRGDVEGAAAPPLVPVEPRAGGRTRPGADRRGHAHPRGVAPRTAGRDRPRSPALRGVAGRRLSPPSPPLPLSLSAFARCHFLEPPVDLKQPVLRAAGARVTMTPRELAEFGSWAGTDAELNDWFFGRMLAKDAVRAAWAEKHGEAMFPADIETDLDEHGRIVCQPRGEPGTE